MWVDLDLVDIFNDIGRWAHFNVKLHFLKMSYLRVRLIANVKLDF